MTRTRARALALALAAIVPAVARAEEGGRSVVIESARVFEYLKKADGRPPAEAASADSSGAETTAGDGGTVTATPAEAEIIRFIGDVMIAVKDGDSTSRIGADEIIYDKTRDILDARGHVVYQRTTGKSGGEIFEGDALLFDIKRQEGVFLGGWVKQDPGKKQSDPYIVHSDAAARDESGTMAFKSGVLTTCDDEDPHWSIRASRIWLLPGNEIALFNALLFVGPLPVFYIPFFYYPADEMIFHPVFGFRNREGYFVQTTTYIYGRKPLAAKKTGEENTFANFLQGDVLKEQRREGLFLRNLDEDAKAVPADYFKLMADAYSSLGALLGVEGALSWQEGIVRKLSVFAAIGTSQTLYPPTSGFFYSTYDAAGDEHRNSGWFFGNELPFRYRFKLDVSADRKPFNVSVSIPLISDPWFKYDYLDRKEDMNWFQLLTEQDTLAKEKNVSTETSYSWTISGSITPDVSALNPWVTKLSISTISGVLSFSSKTNSLMTGQEASYSPERSFFYPEVIKPEIKLSIAGTLLSSDSSTASAAKPGTDAPGSGLADPWKQGAIPIEGDESAADGETAAADKSVAAGGVSAADQSTASAAPEGIDRLFPKAGQGLVPVTMPPVLKYALTYSIDPQFLHQTRYMASDSTSPEEIAWDRYASLYYQFTGAIGLTASGSYDTDLVTFSSGLAVKVQHQAYTLISDDEYTESQQDTMRLNEYKSEELKLVSTDALSFVPFNRDELFKPTRLDWNLTANLFDTEFVGTVDDPRWRRRAIEWDREFVTAHATSATIGVAIGKQVQTFKVTSNLPPMLDSYQFTSAFNWPIGSLSTTTKLYEKEDAEKTWYWDPFAANLSWKLPYGFSMSQAYVYDIEEDMSSKLTFSASWLSLSANYAMSASVPYRLDPGSGWVLDGTEKEFMPSSAGLTFDNTAKPLKLRVWKNRVALDFALKSLVSFDLIRLTESYFVFNPSITLKIHEFLDISLSSESRNDVIARYCQDWMDLPAPLPGERNLWVDLVNSFSFHDTNLRKESGFKLKKINFSIIHYLHDWTLNLTYSMEPELNTEKRPYRYEFIPEVTFSVIWKPISDIKTKVKTEDGVFYLNPADESE